MRSKLFVVVLAVLALAGGYFVWQSTESSVDLSARPLSAPSQPKPKAVVTPAKSTVVVPPAPAPGPKRDPRAIDPEIQKLADRLANHDEQTPLNDLETVNEFVELYRKSFSNQSVGSNEDLTAILTGKNPKEGVLFPQDSPMIVKGQIVDRWGTPYWVHPNSGARIEVRSAGPDKDLFTPDDVILNASPGGLGATPVETP